MRLRQIIFLLSALLLCRAAVAQSDDRLMRIRESLDSLAAVDARYNEPIDLSVTNFSVADLLKTIAIENSLNVIYHWIRSVVRSPVIWNGFLSRMCCCFAVRIVVWT